MHTEHPTTCLKSILQGTGGTEVHVAEMAMHSLSWFMEAGVAEVD
jgi:hypothetical protein